MLRHRKTIKEAAMKIQKTTDPIEDRMKDYRAAELEKAKAVIEYVAIMADVEIPQEEEPQQEAQNDEL